MLPSVTSKAIVSFGEGSLRVSRRGNEASVLLVALSRPKVKNAFSDGLYLDLIAMLEAATVDDSISAVVLTGSGSYFSSGADLNGNFLPEDGASRDTLSKPAGRFMMALLAFPKVIAAAVNGPAVGIGVTTLLHCDLCYCTPNATFWVPFTRLALVPEFSSSATFVETMGLAKANDLLLLGKKIDATKAVDWNICSEVVADCDNSGDPFHKNSLASKISKDIDERLLSLPLGDKTSQIFCAMIRGKRRARLEQICKEELVKLDERFDGGECLEAVMHLNIGTSKSKL
mmetsp:Transcript_388/g.659  ORF Transcript_388/g.659 Transcript_388/m.659 type:complete len:287 (-) Transcript_388:166-1026(-)